MTSRTLRTLVRRLLPLLALIACLAFVVGACGGDDSSGSEGDPASLAPASAPLYIEGTIRPEGAQKTNAEQVLGKVMRTDDPSGRLKELLEKELREEGDSYARDIEPWLGDRVGVFVTNLAGDEPDAVVVAATKDEDKARESLERENNEEKAVSHKYRDVEYAVDPDGDASAVVKGFLLTGDEPAFKQAVDVSKGEASLVESKRFENASKDVPDERLGLFYLDFDRVIDALAADRDVPALQRDAVRKLLGGDLRPVVATLTARPDGVAVDARARTLTGLPSISGQAPEILKELPADAWLAFGAGDLGKGLKALVDRVGEVGIPGLSPELLRSQLRSRTGLDLDRDLLDWVGDVGVFVQGDSERTAEGGLVIESTDPDASRAAVGKLAGLVKASGDVQVSGSGSDFTVRDPDLPKPVRFAARGERVVVVYGADAARAALDTSGGLGEAPAFQAAARALGDGMEPSGFVSFPAVVKLLDSSDAASDDDYRQARAYLRALTHFVAGSNGEGDDVVQRIVIGVR